MLSNKKARSPYFWIIPIIFALHNAEEYYFFPEMKYFRPVQMEENMLQSKHFFIAILLLTVFVCGVVMIHDLFLKKLTLYMVLFTQTMIFTNGIVHLVGAILKRGYVPGLGTAFFLIIPFSLFLFWKGNVVGWWKWKHVWISCIIGILLIFPILAGLLYIVRSIA
ncbi:HXXEE domain-containing protein [Bacillus sp. BP-3]|uniref:HXXEE domain-containing protein n=1 Tax=Bacillus sp. BP-3 TaxID=3022773 RepID=UPI00232F2759|nr:HXXEE domain-containing protein [Bacillus sp. BP-3]MDC2863816.1 HXXEE domain-containing protein [Bacillus sp. BP-3]